MKPPLPKVPKKSSKYFYVIPEAREQANRKHILAAVKFRVPTNQENVAACMGRFLHDQHIIKEYYNKNKMPNEIIKKVDPKLLKIIPADKVIPFDLMTTVRSASTGPTGQIMQPSVDRSSILLPHLANPYQSKSVKHIERLEKLKGYHPISKQTRIQRKNNFIPDFVPKQILDDDSLLSIDSAYDPEAHIQLRFEEFTRAICKFKHKIAKRLVRNIRLTEIGKKHNFKHFHDIIMNMENGNNRKKTLKPFEDLVQEIPAIFFVGRMLVNREIRREALFKKAQKEAARLAAINQQRQERLDYFRIQEERWIGSVNFIRKGEIAEKDMMFLHPDDEFYEKEFDKDIGQGKYEPVKNIQAGEYARLSANEKKQVYKFIYDSYAHKQTEANNKVNSDNTYFNQLERTLADVNTAKKINFKTKYAMKNEILIGRSNPVTSKTWTQELENLRNAFPNGVRWDPKAAFTMVDSREKPNALKREQLVNPLIDLREQEIQKRRFHTVEF